MDDQPQVIDATARFRNQRPPAPRSRLQERLRSTKRLSSQDKRALAVNLGKIAERINPGNPRDGAMQIIKESGLQEVQGKRKRFIRLPSEPAPERGGDGEYGATGGHYASLIDAAASLLIREHPNFADQERVWLFRTALTGTTFVAGEMPLAPTANASVRSWVEEYASLICERVTRETKLLELWEVIENSSIGIDLHPDDRAECPADGHVFPNELTLSIETEAKGAHFVAGIHDYYNWSEPRVQVGTVAVRGKCRIFVIPQCMSDHFSKSLISQSATEWLRGIGHDGQFLPDVNYSSKRGYGWKEADVSCLVEIDLRIVRGKDGVPKMQVSAHESARMDRQSFRFAVSLTKDVDWHERHLLGLGSDYSMVSFYFHDLVDENDEHDPSYRVHQSAFLAEEIFSGDVEITPVVGMLDSDWGLRWEVRDSLRGGWTEHPLIQRILLTSDHFVYPTEYDEDDHGSLNGGVIMPEGSLAALLMSDLKARPDSGFHAQIIERAELTAEAGLRFHEQSMREARTLLNALRLPTATT